MADWSITRRRSARRVANRFVAVAVATAVAAAGLAATASAQDRYTDVTNTSHRSHKANIDALEELGVFDGTECGARKFCPGDAAKRWAVAVWIVRVVDGKDPFPVQQSMFADVDGDDWWMPYVERLADLGVTVGCKQNPLRYCPHDTVSRGQMASFLMRAFRLQRAGSARFTDTGGNTHEAAIDSLYAAGLTVGCNQTLKRYCPRNAVSRAQMASLLNRGRDEGGTTTTPTTPTTPSSGSITVGTDTRSGDTLLTASRVRTCAILSDETVTCWGGEEGLLEHHSASGLDDVVALSSSNHHTIKPHTCAVHDNGDLSCWGPGADGQLGIFNTTHQLPTLVPGIDDAEAVAAGPAFTCVVHRNGRVSCWGLNQSGQLGESSRTTSGHYFPEEVRGLTGVVAIAGGQDHVCTIDRDGDLECWGGLYGDSPTTVTTPDEVSSVSMGGIQTCVTTVDGLIYCWNYGATRTAQMTRIGTITDAVKVSVGNGTACALHNDGGVSCWGHNDLGQVGDGTTTRRQSPVRLTAITDAVDVSVSSGSRTVGAHACALRQDRSALCWGGNEIGQLEDGSLDNGLTPGRVRMLGRIPRSRIPETATDLLLDWVDEVVVNRGTDFDWLWVAWDFVRDETTVAEVTDGGGDVTSTCVFNSQADPIEIECTVASMTISEISLETVVHQLARVYDLHTDLAAPREVWGAVQLYFASRYPRCDAGTDEHGSQVLANTMLHLTVPHAHLDYYEGRACTGLPRAPTREAEQVLADGLDGLEPDWYRQNVRDGEDLWTFWRRGPSLLALANLMDEFDGLCTTSWISVPLTPADFPAANTDPFNDGGC